MSSSAPMIGYRVLPGSLKRRAGWSEADVGDEVTLTLKNSLSFTRSLVRGAITITYTSDDDSVGRRRCLLSDAYT